MCVSINCCRISERRKRVSFVQDRPHCRPPCGGPRQYSVAALEIVATKITQDRLLGSVKKVDQ